MSKRKETSEEIKRYPKRSRIPFKPFISEGWFKEEPENLDARPKMERRKKNV
jgi:hypothetical protein